MTEKTEFNSVPPTTAASEIVPVPLVEKGGYVWPTPIMATDLASLRESVKKVPVKDCFREIDPTTWIIAGRLLLKHHPEATSPLPGVSWYARKWIGGYYALQNAPHPLPKTYPVDTTRHRFGIIHGDGYRNAVFFIGDVLLKVKIIKCQVTHATREHTTLAWLAERKQSFSFQFPEVIAHYEFDGRYFLFINNINLCPLHVMWKRSMTDLDKKAAADRIAAICHELAAFKKTDGLPSAVDGGDIGACLLGTLNLPGQPVVRSSPEAMARNCKELGLDCSDLVLAHNDLSWGNVLLDQDKKTVAAIIDWETAGFVPRIWIRSNIMLSKDYVLPPVVQGDPPRRDYADLLSEALRARGYPEMAAELHATESEVYRKHIASTTE